MFELRLYRQSDDSAAAYALLQRAVGEQWPITEADFHHLLTSSPLYQDGDYVVASEGERMVGFVAAQVDRNNPEFASIAALLVDPQFQRRGIGTALHAAALAHLQTNRAGTVQLGGGGYGSFWPGVPTNLPTARPFFEARGWTFNESCFDLAQRMEDYRPPDDPPANALVELATPGDAAALLEFERREFPHWLGPFQSTVDVGDFHDLLIARDPASRAIVGSLILYSPGAHPSRLDGFWKALLGDPLGEIGCVGVTGALHGQGIGSAMMLRASDILKQRGVVSVHIGWVYRVNFYCRLGYPTWRKFDMSWRHK
jgi:beta-N-acetylhexosaminidase